jgi:hypothetical protein
MCEIATDAPRTSHLLHLGHPSEILQVPEKSEAIYKHFNSGPRMAKIDELSGHFILLSKSTGTVRSEAAPSLTARWLGWAGAWLKSMDGGP